MLTRGLYQQVEDALVRVPLVATMDGRTILLQGIPTHIINSLNRSDNQKIDIHKLIGQLDNLGRLEDSNATPLIIFLDNARQQVMGTATGRALTTIIQDIEKQDKEVLLSVLEEHKEALVHGGNKEKLSYKFFTKATHVTQSVARLHVTPFFGNRSTDTSVFGTGWLVTPELLITNYHVVTARDDSDRPATENECQKQVQHMQVRFDYFEEDSPQVIYRCLSMIAYDPILDFALVRLQAHTSDKKRSPLEIAPERKLEKDHRLNIMHYAQGYPLQFAIRNNFYIDNYGSDSDLHYVTDTEFGSSGAPVCNDNWQVVAMHCKSIRVRPETYKSETIHYHNIGIEIQAILSNLPDAIYQEISEAQGWS